MKRNFVTVPLGALRRFRPGRKTILLAVYFIVVCLVIAVAAWRATGRFEAPLRPGESVDMESDLPAVRPEVPFNALDEEEVLEQVLPDGPAAPLAAPQEALSWPVEGEILAGHHEPYKIGNQWRVHVGVDIRTAANATIYAAWPGVVIDVSEDSRYGLLLEIDHGAGFISQYGNLADAFFAVGDEVKSGDPIGSAGETALLDASKGCYLHFSLYRDGIALDPVKELNK